MRRPLLLCLTAALTLPLGSCATYSKVREHEPEAVTAITTVPQGLIAEGAALHKKQPAQAMGKFLAAARLSAVRLQSAPQDAAALHDYNLALNQLFTTLREANMNPWNEPQRIPGPDGEFILTCRLDARHPEHNPALYEYVPSANLEIDGSYLQDRTLKPGLGAALVAVRREPRKDAAERFAVPRAFYGVTAVARFTGDRCEIAFEDPLRDETVTMGRRRFPLGADFSAPFALMLNEMRPRKLEILNLLRPGEPAESARIVRLQSFDPNKTTVLVVHGLIDSPATWVPMLNALRGDPEIRKHFQFWFYGYPSGYPYHYSAAVMRRELDAATKAFPQKKPMILIGHSMGGLISRLMVTDSGDRVWNRFFPRPPDQMKLSEESRKVVTESFIFQSRKEAGRVIFIASPHRGSNMASSWLARMGAKLIRSPQTLLKASFEALEFVVSDDGVRAAMKVPTSVDTLSPENPFVQTINQIPLRPGVPYHSIIGDRGKGGGPDSSDGFVPYWSSHLEGAASETIVPSNHSAHQNREAIAEVLRILKNSRR